eukprot:TRINITY_DN7881_c0_g1_i4.p1 TRINITY_DN7881_c0_g1~~TRINITY_DN7881_c0_g1_i4.p1  ORF type:complete len:289 (-),score=61.92 TRINITY_DN7881_c0_g1_i4:39-905(-)
MKTDPLWSTKPDAVKGAALYTTTLCSIFQEIVCPLLSFPAFLLFPTIQSIWGTKQQDVESILQLEYMHNLISSTQAEATVADTPKAINGCQHTSLGRVENELIKFMLSNHYNQAAVLEANNNNHLKPLDTIAEDLTRMLLAPTSSPAILNNNNHNHNNGDSDIVMSSSTSTSSSSSPPPAIYLLSIIPSLRFSSWLPLLSHNNGQFLKSLLRIRLMMNQVEPAAQIFTSYHGALWDRKYHASGPSTCDDEWRKVDFTFWPGVFIPRGAWPHNVQEGIMVYEAQVYTME